MKQPKASKALNAMLIISMVWLGVGSYIPSAYAETNTAPVQENQSETTLSKLEIEGIELDQKFAADLYEYAATVGNEIETMKLLVESTNPESSITINGHAVISGAAGTYSLQTGENKFIIFVNNDSGTATTYTLTITREKNANNLLQNIELSKGELSPKFSSAVTDYKVEVPNEVPEVTIKPTAIETTSTIKVDGSLVVKDGVSVTLPVGKTDIIITVTAENGVQKTYTIHVTQAKALEDKAIEDKAGEDKITTPNQNNKPGFTQPISKANNRTNSTQPTTQQQGFVTPEKVSKALLSSLSVSEGTWDSTFTSEEFTYHVKVSSDVEEITLKPIAKYSSSEILIEGDNSKTIKLEDDKKTIISVVVTNYEDDRKTYVLVIDKES
ncbi:cadherin-like beta sandwich domain-containing protein [Bacillaceae bacterium C204]|uniref:cadherin-like beta sandwich domain-containing protein n=1 Tax=Neobacillus sp. 204 TaxID=3383351 RepID=UPI00397B1425